METKNLQNYEHIQSKKTRPSVLITVKALFWYSAGITQKPEITSWIHGPVEVGFLYQTDYRYKHGQKGDI